MNFKPPSRWQELTGLLPEFEADMSREDRRDAVRTLVSEVERLALAEFKFAAEDPSGERTYLWDPLDYICNVLEISRVKLSAYTRELTGMRAHEITDRLKAASLPELLRERLESRFTAMLPGLKSMLPAAASSAAESVDRVLKCALQNLRAERAGAARQRWAIELGFANPSRLSRACLLAHGCSIHELEERLLRTLVQKFFETSAPIAASDDKRADAPLIEERLRSQLKSELGLDDELSPDEQATLDAISAPAAC